MSVKNYLLIGIARLLSSKKNFPKNAESPRILVVSTTGLGDSLWGTPAIHAIKTAYPKAHLALLTSPIGAELFRNSPYIDEVFTLKNPALPSCIQLFPKLRQKQFDTALIFHLSQRPVLPLVSVCAPSQIIGTRGINKGLDSLLTKALEPKYEHEIERRLALAAAIGAPRQGAQMELFLTFEEKELIQNFLKEKRCENHPLIVGIHPGAKDRFKQWDKRHFIALGKRLAKEKNARLFVTGSLDEKTLADSIANEIPGAESVAGKFPVRLTAALIGRFHLFLTNDTGPMHIAYAMKTPTFSLFAPTDPALCGPYEISHARWIQKPPTCHPCIRKGCRSPFCLEQISEEEAWNKVSELLI